MIDVTTPSQSVEVIQLTRRDERAAVATLAAAFAEYPLVVALAPNPHRRPRACEAFARMQFRLALKLGGAFATADHAAVACAFPPGHAWPSDWDYFQAGASSLMWRCRFRGAWWLMRHGHAFDHHRAKHMGDRPHWYVSLLGVRPDRQGRGLSRAVLQPIFDAADREHLPVFLETMPEWNVPIYRKLGFNLLGHSELPGGLPNWELCREPQ